MVYIGVIGAGSCSRHEEKLAWGVGRAVAHSGALLVCGGMGGVMEHACRGAREAGGVTLGILPGDGREVANPYLSYSVPTGIGEARNLIVVKSSHGLVAVGGCYGTLSEIAFALKMGKKVIGIGTWKLINSRGETAPIDYEEDPDTAVNKVLDYINNITGSEGQ